MLSRKINNRRSGQTLVIAIMVMFILSVISAVFVALVARNLFRSERFSHVDSVAQIAEAGIRYADKMMVSGEDGADWRPKPDNLGATNTPNPAENVLPVMGVTMGRDWTFWKENHPDFKWIRPYWPTELSDGRAGPSGGFTTFNTGGGRFLLRVSYDPKTDDPLSKYIKIESIGRWGFIDNDDPTTLAGHGNTGMRREITAYKPIGVTDYLRYITNKDHRSIDFPLGCPGYHSIFGRPDRPTLRASASRYGVRGAPIRVNGNLVFYGIPNTEPATWSSDPDYPSIDIFLRGVATNNAGVIPLDSVEVAGEIKKYSSDSRSVGVRVNVIEPDGNITYAPGRPTSETAVDWSVGGFWRDGESGYQAGTHIKYLEPPLLDNPDTTDTTTRYRILTLSSGERINGVNIGRFGWGRGIYIDNTNDVQDESNTLFGGYSLRSDWLKPNNPMSSYWKGPFYTPPGVYIVLNPKDTDGDGQFDMTITRTDGRVWHDPDGNARPDWGSTITVPYPDSTNGRVLHWRVGNNNYTRTVDGNGVIYAEGNIRMRGMLAPNVQLTVVSNENIYIEGSVLKYRDPTGTIADNDPWRATGTETESCGIALLARQNVCVNTTQFFSPTSGVGDNIDSDNSVIISNDPDSRLRTAFEFGPYESDAAGANTSGDHWLFLRHSGQYGTSYINAWLNARSGLTDWGILYLNDTGRGGLPRHVWGIGDPSFNTPGWGIDSSYIGEAFPLTPGTSGLNATLYTKPGVANDVLVGLDQTTYTRNNYLFGGMAVQPMDVRIEAVIYAQEGSFFVLPGRWFNPNPTDTPENNAVHGRPGGVRNSFPYFGQPLDIRVIIDGAISENMPATISDVSEWMSKWGRIPATYGSSGIDTAHPGEGLTILYDDHAGWPYTGLGSSSLTPIRTDKYGRTLPIAPRLPVSGSLIYFGDVM